MKKYRALLLGLLLFAIVVLMIWFTRNREPMGASGDHPATLSNGFGMQIRTSKVSLTSGIQGTNANSLELSIQERLRAIREDPMWDWKHPITFYGKIVDEDSAPVAKATAQLDWADAEGKGLHAAKTTDSAGVFSLAGARGKRLQVRVEKDGYYPSKRRSQISFEYADPGESIFHKPDPNNPVLFYLKKKGSGVDLVSSQNGARPIVGVLAPTNGAPVFVDLFTRNVGSTGQLQVQGWKEPKDRTTGHNNWGFRLGIPDGGLVEHDDEFPFEAPEAGYQPALEWHFTNGAPDWQSGLIKSFYIKFGQPPRYGRIKIHTDAFFGNAFLEYAINPTGSRNLEEAPKAPPKPGTVFE